MKKGEKFYSSFYILCYPQYLKGDNFSIYNLIK